MHGFAVVPFGHSSNTISEAIIHRQGSAVRRVHGLSRVRGVAEVTEEYFGRPERYQIRGMRRIYDRYVSMHTEGRPGSISGMWRRRIEGEGKAENMFHNLFQHAS